MSALNYGLTPKMKPISPRRNALVAALDVGSSKVACLIARLRPHPPQQVLTRRSHSIEVVGYGHAAARGTKAGGVVNLAAAEEAIRQAVDGAERMASVEIESVILSISAGRLSSEVFAAEIDIAGTAVSEGDIARVLAAGNRHSLREGRAVLHSLPIGYSIDAGNGIRDPRGMLGSRFGVDMHVATTDVAAARNLMLAVERCHLVVEAMAASPYVAGLSVLADDEADLGAAVVDMGAGTTTSAVFLGGRFVHSDGFALGGHHVTMDIARGLNASVADAERIKTFYGSVLAGGSDERDMITVPPVSEDEREQAQFVPALGSCPDHQAAGRGNSGNGARPAGGVFVRRGTARQRHPHRRREPDGRASPNSPPAFWIARCASAARSALPDCRTPQEAARSPRRPDFWSIRRRRNSNISNTAASGT